VGELELQSLADVSRELGVPPLEVVRLCGLAGIEPETAWAFDPHVAARLAEVGGITPPWSHVPALRPLDRVRETLNALAERGHTDDHVTRLDNVWRGLPRAEQVLLEDVFLALADLGWVRLGARAEGRMVSLGQPVPEPLQAFLDGGEAPAPLEELLAALLQGRPS